MGLIVTRPPRGRGDVPRLRRLRRLHADGFLALAACSAVGVVVALVLRRLTREERPAT
ncbi:hypothetical protein HHL19_00895 [Streptomyces sp. R302]|uniref:hypothetical protein n=1 Tax=unclassified Streptomyces TaxID=2593676 RepID=UPI00145EC34C|nr:MULTISPECIES: hypothetical protein [unclassified Streptomyces]NML48925.1 hypothetical protein [Streptomyces sp. R301]NML77252.1 hypothetical protein [Streptomyces sp. R302]